MHPKDLLDFIRSESLSFQWDTVQAIVVEGVPLHPGIKNFSGTHRLREWTYGYQWGSVAERDRLGVWDCHVYTAIFKVDNQQGPTVKKNFLN